MTKEIGRQLLRSALDGDSEKVRNLLATGCSINHDTKGATPLMHASRRGNDAVVRILLDKGADLEMHDKEQGWTALMFAVRFGKSRVARMLLQAGASTKSLSKDEFSALIIAARYGQEECVKLLIEANADLNHQCKIHKWTALMFGARFGYAGIVQRLVDAGADLRKANNDEFPPLSLATYFGNLEVVRILMDARADVEQKNKDGDTPLFIASRRGKFEILDLFLENGANVHARNNYGQNLRRICQDWKQLKKILKQRKINGTPSMNNRNRTTKRKANTANTLPNRKKAKHMNGHARESVEAKGKPVKKSHKKKMRYEEASESRGDDSKETWQCSQCTLENPAESVKCMVCGYKKKRKAFLAKGADPKDEAVKFHQMQAEAMILNSKDTGRRGTVHSRANVHGTRGSPDGGLLQQKSKPNRRHFRPSHNSEHPHQRTSPPGRPQAKVEELDDKPLSDSTSKSPTLSRMDAELSGHRIPLEGAGNKRRHPGKPMITLPRNLPTCGHAKKVRRHPGTPVTPRDVGSIPQPSRAKKLGGDKQKKPSPRSPQTLEALKKKPQGWGERASEMKKKVGMKSPKSPKSPKVDFKQKPSPRSPKSPKSPKIEKTKKPIQRHPLSAKPSKLGLKNVSGKMQHTKLGSKVDPQNMKLNLNKTNPNGPKPGKFSLKNTHSPKPIKLIPKNPKSSPVSPKLGKLNLKNQKSSPLSPKPAQKSGHKISAVVSKNAKASERPKATLVSAAEPMDDSVKRPPESRNPGGKKGALQKDTNPRKDPGPIEAAKDKEIKKSKEPQGNEASKADRHAQGDKGHSKDHQKTDSEGSSKASAHVESSSTKNKPFSRDVKQERIADNEKRLDKESHKSKKVVISRELVDFTGGKGALPKKLSVPKAFGDARKFSDMRKFNDPKKSGDSRKPNHPKKLSDPKKPIEPKKPADPKKSCDAKKLGDPKKPSDPKKTGEPKKLDDPRKLNEPKRSGDPKKCSDPKKFGDPKRHSDPKLPSEPKKVAEPKKVHESKKVTESKKVEMKKEPRHTSAGAVQMKVKSPVTAKVKPKHAITFSKTAAKIPLNSKKSLHQKAAPLRPKNAVVNGIRLKKRKRDDQGKEEAGAKEKSGSVSGMVKRKKKLSSEHQGDRRVITPVSNGIGTSGKKAKSEFAQPKKYMQKIAKHHAGALKDSKKLGLNRPDSFTKKSIATSQRAPNSSDPHPDIKKLPKVGIVKRPKKLVHSKEAKSHGKVVGLSSKKLHIKKVRPSDRVSNKAKLSNAVAGSETSTRFQNPKPKIAARAKEELDLSDISSESSDDDVSLSTLATGLVPPKPKKPKPRPIPSSTAPRSSPKSSSPMESEDTSDDDEDDNDDEDDEDDQAEEQKWQCTQCTLENSASDVNCAACGFKKPRKATMVKIEKFVPNHESREGKDTHKVSQGTQRQEIEPVDDPDATEDSDETGDDTDIEVVDATGVDDRRFKCRVCSKLFKRRQDVRRHKISHSDQRNFSCQECGKKFKRNQDLSVHMASHSQEKKFRCTVCDKKFKRRQDIKRHMIFHNEEKNVPCMHPGCEKRFKRKQDMNAHALRCIHGKI